MGVAQVVVINEVSERVCILVERALQRTVIEVPYVESVFALKMMFKQHQGRTVRPDTVQ
jgi:hypothetical protein